MPNLPKGWAGLVEIAKNHQKFSLAFDLSLKVFFFSETKRENA